MSSIVRPSGVQKTIWLNYTLLLVTASAVPVDAQELFELEVQARASQGDDYTSRFLSLPVDLASAPSISVSVDAGPRAASATSAPYSLASRATATGNGPVADSLAHARRLRIEFLDSPALRAFLGSDGVADVVVNFTGIVSAGCQGNCSSVTAGQILLNRGDNLGGSLTFINGDLNNSSGMFEGFSEAGGEFFMPVSTKLRSSSFAGVPARTIEVSALRTSSSVISTGSGSSVSDFRIILKETVAESIVSANGTPLQSLGISYEFKPQPAAADCDAGGDAFHLQGGRFRIDICWDTGTQQGFGKLSVRDGDGATVWFFNPSNPEVFLKILDACVSPFDRFWVFIAGLTNVGVTVKVTDTAAGASQTYESSPGRVFEAIQDTTSFATCP
jgi:hypothetical protein